MLYMYVSWQVPEFNQFLKKHRSDCCYISNCSKSISATLVDVPNLANSIAAYPYPTKKYQLNELIDVSSTFSISAKSGSRDFRNTYYFGDAYADYLQTGLDRPPVLGFNSFQKIYNLNHVLVNANVDQLKKVRVYFDNDPGVVEFCSTSNYKISFLKDKPDPAQLVCKSVPFLEHSIAGLQDTFISENGTRISAVKLPYFIEDIPVTENTRIKVTNPTTLYSDISSLASLPIAPASTALKPVIPFPISGNQEFRFSEHPGTVEICDTPDVMSQFNPVDKNIFVGSSYCSAQYQVDFEKATFGSVYQFKYTDLNKPVILDMAFNTNAYTTIMVYFGSQVWVIDSKNLDILKTITFQGPLTLEVVVSSDVGKGHFKLWKAHICPVPEIKPRTDAFKDHTCFRETTNQFIYKPMGKSGKASITNSLYQLPLASEILFPANTILRSDEFNTQTSFHAYSNGDLYQIGHRQVSIVDKAFKSSLFQMNVFARQTKWITICSNAATVKQIYDLTDFKTDEPTNCKSISATLVDVPNLANSIAAYPYSTQKYKLNELIDVSSTFSITAKTYRPSHRNTYYFGDAYSDYLQTGVDRPPVFGFDAFVHIYNLNHVLVNTKVSELKKVQVYFDSDPGVVKYCSSNDYKITFLKVFVVYLG
eukprot:NODE_194_length_13294_cov_0.803714.p1 type:complete len:649 gc:universal NODE_194_length_13294_cov_0.803714:1129-3075(+)